MVTVNERTTGKTVAETAGPDRVSALRRFTMLAYHNNPGIKTYILAQLARHHAADEIVKGQYWENGKGCAVGCTIYGNDHSQYELLFGIPQILALLEDRIFEGLPNSAAKEWPKRFMGAIRVGADLSNVWPQFVAWLLVDPVDGVLRFAKTNQQRQVIQTVADLYTRGETSAEVWRKASTAAYAAAAYAANAHARRGTGTAAAAAYANTRSAFYVKQADKLVMLLEAA